MAQPVMGYCPMGCGETLVRLVKGVLSCWNEDCPNPLALQQILDDPETEHVVLLGEKDFTVQHPLRERLDGDLFSCTLHARITAMPGPPHPPGRYRVTPTSFVDAAGPLMQWERLD